MAQIAIDAGFLYGAQLPGTTYFPLHFADQNWKRPNWPAYLAAIRRERPALATVTDLERVEQLPQVLGEAEELAAIVETVIIIPKVQGIIPQIPEAIANCPVRLGYSVPTQFGGTELPIWEFGRRPVHLLGGAPQKQIALAHYLNVVSADGNYARKMANRYCQYWTPGNARGWAKDRHWPTLREHGDGARWDGDNAHHEAWRRSCHNIIRAWEQK